jgi:hypothetical protein
MKIVVMLLSAFVVMSSHDAAASGGELPGDSAEHDDALLMMRFNAAIEDARAAIAGMSNPEYEVQLLAGANRLKSVIAQQFVPSVLGPRIHQPVDHVQPALSILQNDFDCFAQLAEQSTSQPETARLRMTRDAIRGVLNDGTRELMELDENGGNSLGCDTTFGRVTRASIAVKISYSNELVSDVFGLTSSTFEELWTAILYLLPPDGFAEARLFEVAALLHPTDQLDELQERVIDGLRSLPEYRSKSGPLNTAQEFAFAITEGWNRHGRKPSKRRVSSAEVINSVILVCSISQADAMGIIAEKLERCLKLYRDRDKC